MQVLLTATSQHHTTTALLAPSRSFSTAAAETVCSGTAESGRRQKEGAGNPWCSSMSSQHTQHATDTTQHVHIPPSSTAKQLNLRDKCSRHGDQESAQAVLSLTGARNEGQETPGALVLLTAHNTYSGMHDTQTVVARQ